MQITPEIITSVITGIVTITVSIIGVWKATSTGLEKRTKEMTDRFEKRMTEMSDRFEKSMTEMSDRFEKNTDKLYDFAETGMVNQAELKTNIENIKSSLGL